MQEKNKTGESQETPKFKSAEELAKVHKAQMQEWKDEHISVVGLNVKSDQSGKVGFIIGKPTGPMLDAVAKYHEEGKPHLVFQLLKNSCIKAGPTELFAQDVDLKNTVMKRISWMLKDLEVEEKEL